MASRAQRISSVQNSRYMHAPKPQASASQQARKKVVGEQPSFLTHQKARRSKTQGYVYEITKEDTYASMQ